MKFTSTILLALLPAYCYSSLSVETWQDCKRFYGNLGSSNAPTSPAMFSDCLEMAENTYDTNLLIDMLNSPNLPDMLESKELVYKALKKLLVETSKPGSWFATGHVEVFRNILYNVWPVLSKTHPDETIKRSIAIAASRGVKEIIDIWIEYLGRLDSEYGNEAIERAFLGSKHDLCKKLLLSPFVHYDESDESIAMIKDSLLPGY